MYECHKLGGLIYTSFTLGQTIIMKSTDTELPHKVSKIRSKIMASIKSKNTKPELKIRKKLHHLGFRYRLYDKNLPGCPDLVLPKYKVVIFVQGCFWHFHNCKHFRWPKTNVLFWRKKILGNLNRDISNILKLQKLDWRICIWWECTIKNDQSCEWSINKFQEWIKNPDDYYLEL